MDLHCTIDTLFLYRQSLFSLVRFWDETNLMMQKLVSWKRRRSMMILIISASWWVKFDGKQWNKNYVGVSEWLCAVERNVPLKQQSLLTLKKMVQHRWALRQAQKIDWMEWLIIDIVNDALTWKLLFECKETLYWDLCNGVWESVSCLVGQCR